MPARSILLAVTLALAGCASAMPGYSPTPSKSAAQAADLPGAMAPDGTYRMSAREQKLSCSKLSGSIVIGIAQLKDYPNQARPSAVARAAQKGTGATLGYSTYGADTEADWVRLRARIEAYNEHLKRLKCTPYDIEAEMKKP